MATLDHVLLASQETVEERETRIRNLFKFFDTESRGYLDYSLIQRGLSALRMPCECSYVHDLLRAWDFNSDGRVDFEDFKRYVDGKEVELYRMFQAIDLEHSGCILPQELSHALFKAGDINTLCCYCYYCGLDQQRHVLYAFRCLRKDCVFFL